MTFGLPSKLPCPIEPKKSRLHPKTYSFKCGRKPNEKQAKTSAEFADVHCVIEEKIDHCIVNVKAFLGSGCS